MTKRSMLVVALFLAASTARALSINTNSAGAYDQVYINPLGLTYGFGGLGWEHAFNHDNSMALEGSFSGRYGSGYSYTALGLSGNYRWYLGEHSRMRGPYIGPKVYVLSYSVGYDRVDNGNGNVYRESASSVFVGGGAQGGYQWLFNGGLTLGLGAEAYFLGGSLGLGPGAVAVGVGGTGIGLIGTVGYAF